MITQRGVAATVAQVTSHTFYVFIEVYFNTKISPTAVLSKVKLRFNSNAALPTLI